MSTEFKLPELGENIETIQVTRVLVAAGDTIAADQPLLEVETDKATIEVPADTAGTVESVLVSDGDEVSVGQAMLTFTDSASAPPAPEPAPAEPAAEPAPEPESAPEPTPEPRPTPPALHSPQGDGGTPYNVPAAPSVRRFAREIGIDVTTVTGSGPTGRISIDDVKLHAKQRNEAPVAVPSAGAVVAPPLPDFEKWGAVKRKKMAVIRRKTAEHMSLSWGQVPHVTIFDKADITELDVLRKRYADRAVEAGGKLTMAVMVCKVVASAMKRFPQFNASIDMGAREIVTKLYVNLGVAVSTARGLVVPVIHNADQKNMVEIAVEIAELAQKARDGKIQLDDLEGGTFTVTNLGRICGTYFTPIINYPEVAILGIGRAQPEAIVRDGQIEMRTMLPLSLSFDHRLIDGADGAQFLGWIIDAIQEPLLLSLQG